MKDVIADTENCVKLQELKASEVINGSIFLCPRETRSQGYCEIF